MNKEKQRIAIAESNGWYMCGTCAAWVNPVTNQCESSDIANCAPDYLNDLNAMHEAEKTLKDEYADMYPYELCKAVGVDPDELPIQSELLMVLHATAAQRAEAFLKTLSKWEDE